MVEGGGAYSCIWMHVMLLQTVKKIDFKSNVWCRRRIFVYAPPSQFNYRAGYATTYVMSTYARLFNPPLWNNERTACTRLIYCTESVWKAFMNNNREASLLTSGIQKIKWLGLPLKVVSRLTVYNLPRYKKIRKQANNEFFKAFIKDALNALFSAASVKSQSVTAL